MSERNEIGNAGPAETGSQPSLDLPGRRRTRAGKLRLVLVALVVIALGASGVTIYLQRLFQQHQDAKQAALNKPKDSGASEAGADLETQKERIKRAVAEQARAASDAAAAATRQQLAAPAGAASHHVGEGGTAIASNRPRRLTAAERRLSGSVLVMSGDSRSVGSADDPGLASSDAGGNADTTVNGSGGDGLGSMAKSMGLAALRGGPSGAAGSSGAGLADSHDAGNSKGSAFDQSLQSSKLQPMRASFRPNRHYLISRSTMIRCGQATAIRTDRPGLVGCPIADDVWSDDGTTLLIRKGALAKGEQRDAVMHGQGVIGAIWDEIDDGDVRIPLNSPATDPLGAAGIPAYIDEHFWTRFGGALMVSLIGDFGQALANKATGSGQTITFTNSSNATQDVAAETLRNSITIPPTAYSNQGSVINIFVARDVDLSSVYDNVGSDGGEIAPSTRQ